MTYSSDDRPALPTIEVTPEMVEAGLDQLREHTIMGDMTYMIEAVYRAMAYAARSSASCTMADR